MAKFELRGTVQLERRLKEIAAKAPKVAAGALFEEANDIMTASKQIVPVEFGALRGSGKVGLPDVRSDNVTVTMGYGDTAVDYAVPVHEIPPPPAKSEGGRSARHEPPTQWKYLERPVNEARSGMTRRLARRMKDRLA